MKTSGGAPRAPFYLFGFLLVLSIASSAVLRAHAAEQNVPVASYSADELQAMEAQAEHHDFQAEVKQLLDILVNSLYSNKDVFLRELISNGSDALGKIRFQSLTDPSALGDKHELAIYIRPDRRSATLHIIDTGVGMTRKELVDNLGRIAKSGTKEFFKQLQDSDGDSSSLIGKFGVGFYSAFLVADKVRVTSKHNSDAQQWVWESTADGSFTVTADPHGNTLGRGTQVSLLLKPSMLEYLDEDNLETLIHRYSEFINFPIYMWTATDVPVAKEAKDEVLDEVADDEEDADTAAAAEDEVEYETVWSWERVNAQQPLWTRDPADISTEQYQSFYKSLSNDLDNPLAWTHFTAEGDAIKFKSLLFVPKQAPEHLFSNQVGGKPIKLFVKRVFITDDFKDLMPKYLSFIQGIVDSDDLDLNVSREVLQQGKLLDTIQRKLVRKAIGMFQELAADEPDKYDEFWRQYGTSIKWGYLEDKHNKQRLEKLMRWESTGVAGLTGLEGYVERMKEGQDQIFYISGQDKHALAASPLLEKLKKKGYEVLFMTEPIDEYVTQTLTRFDDYALTNVAKEGLKLDGDEELDMDALNDKYKSLVDFLKQTLTTRRASNVVLSQRLDSVPAALVSGQWGWTAAMERIVKSQALADKTQAQMMRARRILEINPQHPIIEGLLERIEAHGEDDTIAANSALLVYHSALLTSGFELEDPLELSLELQRVLTESLVATKTTAGEEVQQHHDKDEL